MNNKVRIALAVAGLFFCGLLSGQEPAKCSLTKKEGNGQTEKAGPVQEIIEVLTQNTDFTHAATINFTELMKAKKMAGVFDENSVKVTETDKEGKKIREVKCNFIKHAEYNREKFAAGKVLFRVGKSEGKAGEKRVKTPVGRYYLIQFNTAGKEINKPYDPRLKEAGLVNYGDFEETDKALYKNEEWFFGEGSMLTDKAAHSGKRSARMLAMPGQKKCNIHAPYCQVKPNTQYNIILWVKAQKAFGGTSLGINCNFYDQSGKVMPDEKITLISIQEATFDWRKIEKIINIPEGAGCLKLAFSSSAKEGDVFIDDLSVTPLESAQAGLNLKDSKARTMKMYPCLNYYFDISEEYETPHIKWLKPAAAGKIKTLYCNYMRYVSDSSKRQAIEFAQRMDIDYTYLPLLKRMTSPSKGKLALNRGDKYADDLEQYVTDLLSVEVQKDYQVIVIQELDFQGVQKEVTEMLLNEVKKGKGLVLLDCKNLPPELEKTFVEGKVDLPSNFSSIPMVCKKAVCRLARSGEGRIALIEMPKQSLDYGRGIPYWEYMHIPAMKAIVWASFSNSATTVDKFADQDGTALKAEVSSVDAQDAFFEITYRDEYNQTDAVDKKEIKLVAGKNEIKIDLPEMSGGLHLADYRLMNSEGKICDFGSCSFTGPLSAGINEITFDREYYRAGEEIKATMALTNIPAGCRLVCEVEDTHNRRIKRMETELTEGQTNAVINFKVEAPLTMLYRLFARVIKDGKIKSLKMAEFSMPFNYPPDDELTAYVWGRQLKIWADNGFDGIFYGFKPKQENALKALCNMNLRPYGCGPDSILKDFQDDRGYEGDGGNDIIRTPCFSDPARWDKIKEKCPEIMINNRDVYYGVRDYLLRDELYLGGKVCFSPSCLADFRTYLKEKYQSLEQLNKKWRSNFKDWGEVMPIQLSEVKAEKENLPQWLDHRMFMNIVFAQYVARNKEIVRELNPNAKMGLSGTGNPGITYNWWELLKYADCLGTYGGIQNDLTSSFQLPGARIGQWTGGYASTEGDHEKYERYYPWSGVFSGRTAYMFFHGSAGTLLMGDLRFTRNGRYAIDEIKELKSGVAKMLFSSERLIDGIGVLYSQSSMFAAWATIGKEYWDGALDSWKYLINDLGLNFRFISYEQLEKGEIDNAKYRLIILPASLSLSTKEIETLREFVKNGGILLADYAPGLYDEHGAKRATGELPELFGIKRNINSKIAIRECNMDINHNLKRRSLPTRYGEEGLELTTAKAFGSSGNNQAPGLIVNQFGKGKAVLLNCVFGDYAKITLGGTGGEMSDLSRGNPKTTLPFKALISDLFGEYGVKRRVSIRAADGKDYQTCIQTVRYKNGPIAYVGMLQQFIDASDEGGGGFANDRFTKAKPSDYVPVEIDFGAEGHIYDVRAGKYLGKGFKAGTSIAPAIAKLYAILPYKVQEIDLGTGPACQAGEAVKVPVTIKTDGGAPGDHVVHVEVIGPDQNERSYYAANIKLENGSGVIEVPTALNDEKGKWQVVVKDVASGVKGECEFELQ